MYGYSTGHNFFAVSCQLPGGQFDDLDAGFFDLLEPLGAFGFGVFPSPCHSFVRCGANPAFLLIASDLQPTVCWRSRMWCSKFSSGKDIRAENIFKEQHFGWRGIGPAFNRAGLQRCMHLRERHWNCREAGRLISFNRHRHARNPHFEAFGITRKVHWRFNAFAHDKAR